jgi:hypothetical protein
MRPRTRTVLYCLTSANEIVLVSEGSGGSPRRNTEFVEDVGEVSRNRLGAQMQSSRDFLVGIASGDQLKNLHLALCQACR